MSHVPKRLASTAAKRARAQVTLSALKQFPPKEVLLPKPSSSTPSTSQARPDPARTLKQPQFFDAETWAALQPHHSATLTAFAHRIGLGKVLTSPAAIQQACTHPSYLVLHEKHRPGEPLPQSNANLSSIGNALLGLFATEYVNSTYPFLPTRVMKAAVSAYVGSTTCAMIAKEMGATPLLRWNRLVRLCFVALSSHWCAVCVRGVLTRAWLPVTAQHPHTTSRAAPGRDVVHTASTYCAHIPT